MNSRMKHREDKSIGKQTAATRTEPDRVPGTTKVRTYAAGGFLYSKESNLKKILARAKLCSFKSEEK